MISTASLDVINRILNFSYNQFGIEMFNIFEHSSFSKTYHGIIDIDGIQHGFVLHSSEATGDILYKWGTPLYVHNFKLPRISRQERESFRPINDNLQEERPELFKVYLMWRKQRWFKEMEKAYNIDRKFGSRIKVESYYAELGHKKGLKVGNINSHQLLGK
jgi:hypothetical protein